LVRDQLNPGLPGCVARERRHRGHVEDLGARVVLMELPRGAADCGGTALQDAQHDVCSSAQACWRLNVMGWELASRVASHLSSPKIEYFSRTLGSVVRRSWRRPTRRLQSPSRRGSSVAGNPSPTTLLAAAASPSYPALVFGKSWTATIARLPRARGASRD